MEPLAQFFFSILTFIEAALVPLIFSLAFIFFLWGVFRYFITGANDEEKRKEGKSFVLWSLIGLVLMFSLWGIVNLLVNSLGFDTRSRPDLPVFGGPDPGGPPQRQIHLDDQADSTTAPPSERGLGQRQHAR